MPHGVLDATYDSVVVEAWKQRWPDANIGIATGHALPTGGYLVVLDVDPRNGGDESLGALEREHGRLPETPTVLTGGGGAHYYLRSPVPLQSRVIADGLDLKASGGYVLAPPSNHFSGGRYVWDAAADETTPIADAPAWLIDAAQPRARPAPNSAGDDASASLLGTAFSVAGWLGTRLTEGRYAVRCPWAHEHSDNRGAGDDSSTVILPPTEKSNFGGFKCAHSHCAKRGWRDVLAALPPHALAEARRRLAPRPAPAPAESSPPDVQPTTDWKRLLAVRVKKDGSSYVESTIANALTILLHDERWRGVIVNDVFRRVVELRDPPWRSELTDGTTHYRVSDIDYTRLHVWLDREFGVRLGIESCAQALHAAAEHRKHHPVRDWLESLKWDGVARLDTWLHAYARADDTAYTRSVGRWWLLSAVARVYTPGCQVDSVLVLEGEQGAGKSSLLRTLGGEYYNCSYLSIGSKDSYSQLVGTWIYELAELDALRGRDAAQIKAYLSAAADTYRPPYGRATITAPRGCVFAATTNEDAYLYDSTGHRRFWPVRVGRVDVAAFAAAREQVLAEAVVALKAGATWHPSSADDAALCAAAQGERAVDDSWEDTIAQWVTRNGVKEFSARTVLEQAICLPTDRHEQRHMKRVADVCRKLGYVRARSTEPGRARVYRTASAVGSGKGE